MDAHKILTAARAPILALSLALALAGCKSAAPAATDDATLTTQVQAHLFADQNLTGQPIQASVANGIVTLNGSVSSDSARTIASGDAAQVAGVKTVVNNLVVVTTPAPAPSVAANTTAATSATTEAHAARPEDARSRRRWSLSTSRSIRQRPSCATCLLLSLRLSPFRRRP